MRALFIFLHSLSFLDFFFHGFGTFLDFFFVSFKEKFLVFFYEFAFFFLKNVEKIDAWMENEITSHL